MFKVKVMSKVDGRKNARRQVSTERFLSVDDARMFVADSIRRQEALCFRSWGMVAKYVTDDGEKIAVDFRPACVLFGGLHQVYDIVSAD